MDSDNEPVEFRGCCDIEFVCPWCGHRFQNSWDYDGDFVECYRCEQMIEVTEREIVVYYHTRKPLFNHPRLRELDRPTSDASP